MQKDFIINSAILNNCISLRVSICILIFESIILFYHIQVSMEE